MIENPQVSVIVPIYNVAKYLDKCIKSIIDQTYTNIDIILVDDGSTDNSAYICDRYARQDSRIQVIHKANGGLVSARKAGIQVATGEYIGYVDGDDWIEPDMYENLLKDMITNNVDLVESNHYMEFNGNIKKTHGKLTSGFWEAQEIIPIMLCDSDFVECRLQPYVWSKLFRKELITDIQMNVSNNIKCGEDIAVTYPYVLETKSIYISDYAGYHYVQRQGSMTTIRNTSEWLNDKQLIVYLREVFQQSRYSQVMLQQLNQYAKSMLLIRQMWWLDRENAPNEILKAFGGMKSECKIVIYGAGRVGQSIYNYLNTVGSCNVIGWIDRDYELYRKLQLEVDNIDTIERLQEECEKVIIAVGNKKAAERIKSYLLNSGVNENKIMWLTEAFIATEYNILSKII